MSQEEEVVAQPGSPRERGREPSRPATGRGKKAQSKEALGALDDRVAQVESIVGGMVDRLCTFESGASQIEDDMANLDLRVAQVESDLEGVKGVAKELVMGDFKALLDQMQASMATLSLKVEELSIGLALVQKAMANGHSEVQTSRTRSPPKLQIPKPKAYDGKRDAQEIDNFVWQMERYFEAMELNDDPTKVRTAALYMSDMATLWWRMHQQEVEKGHTPAIETWETLKTELKKQFYPVDATFQARDALMNLRHSGPIRQYIQKFSDLALQLPDMGEKDKLYHFLHNLSPWARQQVKLAEPTDLASALRLAEKLADVEIVKPRTNGANVLKPDENANGEGPSKSVPQQSGGKASTSKEYFPKEGTKRHEPFKKPKDNRPFYGKCFFCDGPHYARDCPTKGQKTVAGMQQQSGEEKVDEAPEKVCRMGTLQLLNTLETQDASETKNLMFVDVEIHGRSISALVDTGATHNFMSEDIAKELGVVMTKKGKGLMKSVNAQAKQIIGVARGVRVKINTWVGWLNFSIVEMDDYPIVLGMEFLKEAKVSFPSLHLMQIGEDCCVGLYPRRMSMLRRITAMRVLPCGDEAKVAKVRRRRPPYEGTPMKLGKVHARVEKEPSPSCACGGCQMSKKARRPKSRGNRKNPKRRVECYLCDGPHKLANCPSKRAFKAFQAAKESRKQVVDEGVDELAGGVCHGPAVTRPSQARDEAPRQAGTVLRAVRGPVGRESAEQVRRWGAVARRQGAGVRRLDAGGAVRHCCRARSMGAKLIEPKRYCPAHCRAVKNYWRYKKGLPSQNPNSTKLVREHAGELSRSEDLPEPRCCKCDVHSLDRL